MHSTAVGYAAGQTANPTYEAANFGMEAVAFSCCLGLAVGFQLLFLVVWNTFRDLVFYPNVQDMIVMIVMIVMIG